jgi:hypothetical protein
MYGGWQPGHVNTGSFDQEMRLARTVAKQPKAQQEEYWRRRELRCVLANAKKRSKRPITLAKITCHD